MPSWSENTTRRPRRFKFHRHGSRLGQTITVGPTLVFRWRGLWRIWGAAAETPEHREQRAAEAAARVAEDDRIMRELTRAMFPNSYRKDSA